METWVQVIIILAGCISAQAGGFAYIAKQIGKNGNGRKGEGGLQHQVDMGTEGTKTLAERFDTQVATCRKDWMDIAKFEGKVEQYMVEIRDRLTKMEDK